MRHRIPWPLAFLLAVLAFGLGYSLQASPPAPAGTGQAVQDGPRPDLSLFWQVWDLVEQQYLGDLPTDEVRVRGAARGMVETLGDPYTRVVDPVENEIQQDQLRGEFGGIGAFLYQGEGGEFTLEPTPDGPADRAGVQRGDRLLRVDGTPILPEMSTDEVVALIRGPVGTPVTLDLQREDRRLTVTVVRERIEHPSLRWEMRPDGVGYIQIFSFSERTAQELDAALANLAEEGATGLVLDLRHNPGGLVSAAVDVVSHFLPEGVVMVEQHRNREDVYKVTPVRRRWTAPVVVLINSGTASAAEIVAGALQDHRRAVLVGEKTFGKGSVQQVYDLEDGSSLHVTVARWQTPNGRPIEGEGLNPDVVVTPADEGDAVLEEAIRLLRAAPATRGAPGQ